MQVVDFESDPPEIWDLYRTLTGRLAFDVGANGGMTTELLVGGFGKVVAFEPASESFAALLELHERNSDIAPVPFAVSDHGGSVELYETTKAMGDYGELVSDVPALAAWGERTGSRVVPATTLDDAAKVWGLPDFVKIDTEGHELPIVEGGSKVFESGPRFVIEVHEHGQGVKIAGLLDAVKVIHSGEPVGYGQDNHYYLVDRATHQILGS